MHRTGTLKTRARSPSCYAFGALRASRIPDGAETVGLLSVLAAARAARWNAMPHPTAVSSPRCRARWAVSQPPNLQPAGDVIVPGRRVEWAATNTKPCTSRACVVEGHPLLSRSLGVADITSRDVSSGPTARGTSGYVGAGRRQRVDGDLGTRQGWGAWIDETAGKETVKRAGRKR